MTSSSPGKSPFLQFQPELPLCSPSDARGSFGWNSRPRKSSQWSYADQNIQRWYRADVSTPRLPSTFCPPLTEYNSHDDITYESIAKAFRLPLKLHDETVKRMKALSKPHPSQKNFLWDVQSPALDAKLRMARLPIDESRDIESQVLFVDESLWVPISVVNGNVHILPGVPRLFTQLLDGLKPLLLPRLENPEGEGVYRILFATPMAESEVAGYLTMLAAEVEPKGVKVGSYPKWGKKLNSVTLVGKDKEYMESLVPQVEKGVDGIRIEREEDADESEDEQEGS